MLIRHSILYISARIAAGVISIATTALLTRLLDPREYGVYGIILTIMAFGSAVAFDWLGITVIRFTQSRRDDPQVRTTIVTIFLALIAITGGLIGASLLIGAPPAVTRDLTLTGVFVVWTYAWCEVAAQFEVASLRPQRYLALYSSRSIFTFCGTVGAAWLTHDPLIVALAGGVGMLSATIFGSLIRVRLNFKLFDRALARQMIGFGMPLALSFAISSVIYAGSRFLLGSLGSIDGLGYYTAGANLVMITLGVITGGLESATYSLAIKAMETGDREATERQLTQNFTLVLAVLMPSALGMALTAQTIAHTILGHQFSGPVAVLIPVMAFGSLFGCIRTCYFDKAFQLGSKPGKQVTVMIVAAAISLAGSAMVVRPYGALGAAVAVSVAQVVSCIQARWAARHIYLLPLPFGPIWRVALACLVMGVVVTSVPGGGALTLTAQIILGAVGYLTTGLILNVLGLRDVALARIGYRKG